jgi:hypothetical protein
LKYNKNITKWNNKYYNCGVIVASRVHRFIFQNPHYFTEEIPKEDLLINLNIHENKTNVHELYLDYNRMHFIDDKIGITRYNSYIIRVHLFYFHVYLNLLINLPLEFLL